MEWIEKAGRFDFQAEGLSLERLLNECVKRGIRLSRVKRVSPRLMTGSVAAKDIRKLKELMRERGWRLTILRERGGIRLLRLVRGRALLVVGVLLFLAIAWASLQCVWFIDIRGAGPYTGEVKRILLAQEVRVGRFMRAIDTDALRLTMERELTGLAFVGVSAQGVRLSVDCVQARLAKSASAVPGDIVASMDGVIETIEVTRGTSLVKAGDVVRSGQVLVRGEERAWNGEKTAVRAEAEILARTFVKARAAVSGTYIETASVGEPFTVRTIGSPYYTLSFDEPPDWETYEAFTRVLPIAGPFPIWLSLTEYQAVTKTPLPRDPDEVRAEAATAAMRLAGEKIDAGAITVDKWVEYSMMEDGSCVATAIVEILVEVGEAG